jgi:hypothetical protein
MAFSPSVRVAGNRITEASKPQSNAGEFRRTMVQNDAHVRRRVSRFM